MDVVVDTDVLSTFLKVGRPDLLLRLFPKSKILLCPSVESEIGKAVERGLVGPVPSDFSPIELARPERKLAAEIGERPALGSADCECLAVARSKGCLLLSNDKRVRSEALSLGVESMSLPLVLRELWRTRVMRKEDVANLADEIERRDTVVIKNRELIFK